MKYGFLRAAAVSPALKVADPAYNAARIADLRAAVNFLSPVVEGGSEKQDDAESGEE